MGAFFGALELLSGAAVHGHSGCDEGYGLHRHSRDQLPADSQSVWNDAGADAERGDEARSARGYDFVERPAG